MDNPLLGKQILVVEDEMLLLMMTEAMLDDLGCETISAATVDQALAVVNGRVVDAALLDMNLNGHKTHRVAAALTERSVPFAFVTGYSLPDRTLGELERPLLKKPFQHEQLEQILRGLLVTR